MPERMPDNVGGREVRRRRPTPNEQYVGYGIETQPTRQRPNDRTTFSRMTESGEVADLGSEIQPARERASTRPVREMGSVQREFIEAHKNLLEGRIHYVRELVGEVQQQLGRAVPDDLRGRTQAVLTLAKRTCDYLEGQVPVLINETGESQFRAANSIILAVEAALYDTRDFVEQYGDPTVDKDNQASQDTGKLRQIIQALNGSKRNILNLISALLAPKELTLKGGVDLGFMMNAGIEIRYGPQ
jgi:hypothetical protein